MDAFCIFNFTVMLPTLIFSHDSSINHTWQTMIWKKKTHCRHSRRFITKSLHLFFKLWWFIKKITYIYSIVLLLHQHGTWHDLEVLRARTKWILKQRKACIHSNFQHWSQHCCISIPDTWFHADNTKQTKQLKLNKHNYIPIFNICYTNWSTKLRKF